MASGSGGKKEMASGSGEKKKTLGFRTEDGQFRCLACLLKTDSKGDTRKFDHNGLVSHITTVHSDLTIVCNNCRTRFPTQPDLVRHQSEDNCPRYKH